MAASLLTNAIRCLQSILWTAASQSHRTLNFPSKTKATLCGSSELLLANKIISFRIAVENRTRCHVGQARFGRGAPGGRALPQSRLPAKVRVGILTAVNTEKLKQLAKDLRKQPPPSPHEKLGGYVVAARSLVKCRAFLLGMNGEYNFHPCGLSAFLWQFTGITPDLFKEFVATGANDEEGGKVAARAFTGQGRAGNHPLEQRAEMQTHQRIGGQLPEILRGIHSAVLSASEQGAFLLRCLR